MYTYLISYDLRQPGKDYTQLHTHLKSYSDWAKPLQSVWLIKSSSTCEQLRNTVQAHMDENDMILVIDVTGKPAAWDKLATDVSAWIKSKL